MRAAWRVTVAEKKDPEGLVFVDEMGKNISLAPPYAYAPKYANKTRLTHVA